MKYYSDVTQRFYDNAEACVKAEKDAIAAQEKEKKEKERLANERKTRAAEVEDARKAMVAAQKKYQEVLEAFIKQFGSYHLSLDGEDAKAASHTLFDLFNPILFNF